MLTRRALLSGAVTAAALPARAEPGAVLIVSRERVLNEVAAARRLREAEQKLTATLQAQVDRTKALLAEEELALAEQRATLSAEEFATRVANFDRRMRAARKQTQELVTALQRAFQRARQHVVDALPAVIEAVRREHGASMIVNADQVLAADPDNDVTDEVIRLYDKMVPLPPIPTVDASALRLDLPGDSQ